MINGRQVARIAIGAAAFGAIGIALALAPRVGAGERFEGVDADRVRSALARSAGVYRALPGPGSALAYAEALLAAGEPEAALQTLAAQTLDHEAIPVATALEAEALLRLRRFPEALGAGDRLLDIDGARPLSSFLRARALYALDPNNRSIAADLLREAATGDPRLAGEAWRARAVMDMSAGDLEPAASALRRAAEAGLPASRANPPAIELLIRQGDLPAAAQLLAQRHAVLRRARRPVDLETARLDGLLQLANADPLAAIRSLDAARPALVRDPRGFLLLAYAKLAGGEIAQAEDLITAHLYNQPDDWVGADLLAALLQRHNDAARLTTAVERLARLNPCRGALAAAAIARAAADPDGVVEALESAPPGPCGGGAEHLTGLSADPPEMVADWRWIEARTAFRPGAPRQRGQIEALIAMDDAPAYRVIAANLLAASGAWAEAAALYRSAAVEPGFAAPALQLSGLDQEFVGADEKTGRLMALVDDRPAHIAARARLAAVWLTRGDAAAAEPVLTPVARELAMTPSGLDLIERVLAGLADGPARARLVKAAMPDDAALRGRLFAASGDHESAVRAFRAALQRRDAPPFAAEGFAVASLKSGSGQEGLVFLDAVAAQRDLDPGLAEAVRIARIALGVGSAKGGQRLEGKPSPGAPQASAAGAAVVE